MNNIKIVNNCSLLLRPVRVEINNASFKIKRNDAQFITLPNGQYELTVRQDWIIKRTIITVEDGDVEIFINRMWPESVFALAIGIMIMLGLLVSFDIISLLFPSIFLIVFSLLLMYYPLFRSKKCFKVTVRQKRSEIQM